MEACCVGVGLGVVALLAGHPLSSPDTFWHLKLGEIIAQTHAVPRTDLFSAVHPERPWVQFAWLWELSAHAVTERFGLRGLRAAQAGLMLVTFATLYLLVRRASGRALPAGLLCACALLLFVDRFQARPDALNLLLGTLAAPLVLGGFRRVSVQGAALVAALALLWVNLHAGTSLLLLGVLLAVLLGALLNGWLGLGPCASGQRRDAVGRAASLFALALLALLVTPGAAASILHFADVFAPMMAAREPEWSPSLVMLRYGSHPAYYATAFAPYAVGLAYVTEQVHRARRLGRAGLDLAEILPCAALLLLSALITRNLFVCLLPLAAIVLRLAKSPRSSAALCVLALALGLIACDVSGRHAYGNFARARVAFAQDLAPGVYPQHAAELMRRAGIEGKVLDFPRWGDYLIERLYPACRVFFDSRRDVTPQMWQLLSDASRPELRARVLDAAFARFGLELVVYEGPVFARYKPEGPWRLLYKAGPEEVYQHVLGEHATENLARVRRDFAARGIGLPKDAGSEAWARTITRAGSEQWLKDPWQRQLEHEQLSLRKSESAAQRQRAERALGLLAFRAGAYGLAARWLEPVLARDPGDASTRYHLAFALFFGEQPQAGRALARAISPAQRGALSAAQRYRLASLASDADAR